MPRLHKESDHDTNMPPLRFPVELARQGSQARGELSGEDALMALENVSRRIDDLARELNCLGWFGDDDDEPRAA